MATDVQLNPKVKVDHLDISQLPLCNFHLIVLVEPDPETWMLPKAESRKLFQVFRMHADLIINELVGEIDPEAITVPIAQDSKENWTIIAGEGSEVIYYQDAAIYCDFIVYHNDFEFEKLRLLLDGFIKNHPEWNRVAVVGAVYEDEIVRAANAVQAAGLETTIIYRYCISESIFVNLDDAWEAVHAERKRLLGDEFDVGAEDDFEEDDFDEDDE